MVKPNFPYKTNIDRVITNADGNEIFTEDEPAIVKDKDSADNTKDVADHTKDIAEQVESTDKRLKEYIDRDRMKEETIEDEKEIRDTDKHIVEIDRGDYKHIFVAIRNTHDQPITVKLASKDDPDDADIFKRLDDDEVKTMEYTLPDDEGTILLNEAIPELEHPYFKTVYLVMEAEDEPEDGSITVTMTGTM